MFRSLGALVGDLLVVILFVTIGFLQHGTPLTSENIVLVGWPFALGVLLGHLAIRAWNAPFRIWPHGLFVWAITLAATMAIRTLFAAGTEVSFIITTAIITAVGMLGWRAVALFLTRGERRRPKVVTGAEAAEVDQAGAKAAGIDGDESHEIASSETEAGDPTEADIPSSERDASR
ncbi:DUF3054 domain-containing protein [Brachybacterium sacelli]|uniref:Peptidoglycan/LPS O-acetylase OafA/YrhL n=1 Tax=Brachybacterium sacelli TaxID=173364 RepID=A0ABS4X4W3_9MICO|nr:DUF3054 domain-containing protein [Brachybacterium sacelli]MBP2383433.1 peptidoglycan/LPS O-acetylase OafA/YrhL [Brachybacterium sacelli]